MNDASEPYENFQCKTITDQNGERLNLFPHHWTLTKNQSFHDKINLFAASHFEVPPLEICGLKDPSEENQFLPKLTSPDLWRNNRRLKFLFKISIFIINMLALTDLRDQEIGP